MLNKVFSIITIFLALSLLIALYSHTDANYQKFRIRDIEKCESGYCKLDLYDVQTDSLIHKSFKIDSELLLEMLTTKNDILNINTTKQNSVFVISYLVMSFCATSFATFILIYVILFIEYIQQRKI